MKKRIMSLVLCLVMVVSLLPTQAHAEEGAECANCGHYHYGDYMCKCGLCSIDCSNSDCWAETHCQNCGECYMDVHTWCDECGWCENCMKDERSHCEDCGRCFVGDDRSEMCEECDKCSDCVGEICDECNKCDDCAGDDHCKDCPAHLEDDDVCGYCKECALTHSLHCEECGGCFEDSAEPCPVHPGETHCEECAGFICERCSSCEYEDGIEPCPDCELCTECCEEISKSSGCTTGEVCVESSDWDDHICEECGECFCEKERCDYCGLCEDCCIENSEAAGCYCINTICVEDPDWDSHVESCHGDGEIPDDHTHRYETEWSVNETYHWHECRFCNEKSNEGEHKLTAAGKCETCGFDTNSPLFFVSQPSSLTRRVTDGNAELDDPNGSLKNRAVFSVSAMHLAGGELEYQWYMGSKALADEEDYISGSKNNVLNVAVPSDGCGNEYEYYCVVKSKDASGNPISIESSHAALRIVHNHGPLKAAEPKNGWHMTVINYTDDKGGKYENVYYSTGSTEHNSFCYGSDCNHTKFKTGSSHSFVYDRYLGSGHFASESASAPVKYFYITKCSECGYKNLLYTEENTELIYNISIIDTPGAYAMNDDDVEGVTKAKTGEHIAVIAPYANKAGNVFDHWEVVSGPDGFTNASIENYFGVGSFNMPADSIALRCVYSTDKVPVKEVQIKGKSPAIDGKGYITVEVGETFTVTSIISPDNVADKRVKWSVDSVGIIKFTDEYSASDAGIVSKDIEGDVSLVALKPGIVRLRALSTESIYASSNTPIQDSVYVKVVPAKGETHNYEETIVYPTCTKNGYTLYECKDENCGHRYQNNIKAATKHKDTDGDGYCDNIDQNTGEVCGKKLIETEKRYPIHVENGRASDSTDKTVVFAKAGEVITITADHAPKNQRFDKWVVEAGGVTLADAAKSTTTFTMPAEAVRVYAAYIAWGSGTGSTTYTVKVLDSKNGSVAADRKTASAGSTVTLTVSPDKGYALDDLTVLDKNDKEIKLTEKNGKYTFTMPASNVEVEATFKAVKSGNPFVDVPSGAYYEDAVIWAVDKGVTSGTDATHFTPNGVCTRAQAVTFLWRAAGSPAPKSTTMPFTDVPAGSYYEQAVLWAVENGITKGTSDTTFSPNATCSRAQIVTFLWRSQKSPAAGSVNPFTDVSADAYYADAVLWAVKESVTSGTTATTFSPNANCTRAQIVTFIWRALAE